MIKLIKGDCLEKMKNIPDNYIDAIITDPPYGTTACKWDSVIPFEPMWEQLHRIIKKNGAIVLFGSEPFSSALRMSNIKMYKYDWIWEKSKGNGFMNVKKMPIKNIENICVFQNSINYYPQGLKKVDKIIKNPKGKMDNSNHKSGQNGGAIKKKEYKREYENYPNQILKFGIEPRPLHNTQKPVLLMEYLIKTYTQENETVLDFTMGSGTTGVACKNLNRKFIGIERDDKYFQIAKERIETA